MRHDACFRQQRKRKLAQRSRKRGRRSKPARGAVAAVTTAQSSPAATSPSRSEQKNAAVRATLTPYAPGERPWSVRIAVLVAALIGVGNLVDLIVGGNVTVGHAHPGAGGVILFSAMMLVAAAGMWRMKYWALLGFQAIVGFVILILALALIGANSILAAVAEVVVIGAAGFLFYKLVRVLSRVQMPRRPQH